MYMYIGLEGLVLSNFLVLTPYVLDVLFRRERGGR